MQPQKFFVVQAISMLMAVTISLSESAPACGVVKSKPVSQISLNQVEEQFFQHDYNAEPMNSRLTRLENLVFGEPRKGADQERFDRIVDATRQSMKVGHETGSPSPSSIAANSPGNAETMSASDTTLPESILQPAGSHTTQNGSASNEREDNHTALNETALNETPPTEAAKTETADITPFAPTNMPPVAPQRRNNSFSGREGRYANSASESTGYSMDRGAGLGSGIDQIAPSNNEHSSSTNIEQSISIMEQQVHGHTNKGRPLPDRLSALEDAAFSQNADHSGALLERVNKLSSALGIDTTNPASLASRAPLQIAPSPLAPSQINMQGYARQQASLPRKEQDPHATLKKVVKTAVVVGAVAGVAALTIAATHGMGGYGIGSGLLRRGIHLDRDRD